MRGQYSVGLGLPALHEPGVARGTLSAVSNVRLSGRPWNLTLIQVYAPTNQAEDQEKENFYTCLQQVHQQIPKQDIVLLSGDFNAKTGKGAPIGKHALRSQNDNGERKINSVRTSE